MSQPSGDGSTLPVEVVERVRRRAAEGTVEGYTQIVGADGELLGDPEMGRPTLGGNWSSSAELNPFTRSRGGYP